MSRNRLTKRSVLSVPSSIVLNKFAHRHLTVLSALLLGVAFIGCKQKTATEPAAAPKPTVQSNQPSPKELEPIDESIDIAALLQQRLNDEDLASGWIRLFDGQSLLGWDKPTSANWRVEDGAIVVDEGAASFLATTGRFGDFELQLEYKAPPTTNSGVFLRSADKPSSPATDCYELNIAPADNPFPTGSLVERQKASSEFDVAKLDPEQWHQMHALVDQNRIQTWVDGISTTDYQDDSALKSGKVLLQFREGPVSFRNIRIRPIGYPVLPSQNLDAWHATNSDKFQYKLTDAGSIEMSGGRADLELLQQMDNFVAQFRVETLAPNTNSGLFFRCIPGSEMDGYECQIHHGYVEDRRRPRDFGTGGIFRRTPARAVLSDEQSPIFVTVRADGRNIATWVQGVQVVDWTDSREPNENPREGYRAEPGTIQLQAHDPDCKVRFDSLLISPIDSNDSMN